MGLQERVATAVTVADQVLTKYLVGNNTIPAEDLATILKYEKLGLVKVINKKPGMQDGIYYPIIQSEALKHFSYSFYIMLVHKICQKYGVKTGLTINSVREYVNRPYQYGFIEPVVVPDSSLGKEMVAEELALLKELFE